MQATADAGVEFLKAQKADMLIKVSVDHSAICSPVVNNQFQVQGLEHLAHKNGAPSNDEQNGDTVKPTKQS
jgi:hypothetical protein